MTADPVTEAGRALLEAVAPPPSDAADPAEEWVADSWAARNSWAARLAAIEREAAAATLARVRERVAALLAAHRPYGGPVDAADVLAAVIAIFDEEADR